MTDEGAYFYYKYTYMNIIMQRTDLILINKEFAVIR